MSKTEQAFSAIRWNSLITFTRVILQTLQLLVLTRLIEPADFGVMAMVLSVTAFIQFFADLGVSTTIIYSQNISKQALSTLYWLNVGTGALLSVLVWFLSDTVADFYKTPALAWPLALAGLSFFFLSLGQQYKVLGEKRLAFKEISISELSSALLSTSLTIGAAFFGFGVYSLVIGVVSLALFNSLFYFLFARGGWLPSLTFKFREALPYMKGGMYLLGTTLSNTLTVQADIIILGRLVGETALGFYSVPRELSLKLMYATNPIITRVGTAIMANAQNDKTLLRRIYLSTILMTSSVNFPIYGAMAIFRHETIDVVFGARWAASADLLGVLAVWGMFRSLGSPVGSLFYGTGQVRMALAQSLLVALLIVPTIYIGGHWGTIGAATALAAFYFCFIFALWPFVIKPLTGAGLWEYTRQWLVPLILVAIASALALVAASPFELSLVRLVVGVATGGIIYLGLSWFFNREWCNAILRLTGLNKRLFARQA
ncbi:hypothetical protein BJF93_03555 [Xaviernesmea oryzae]|uniref:Uncharacterized protein n=1 Tax=Xaviernesmea oryzae TaxID=464029 RepID=A0A1Q9AU72_9HYPH|nr:MOP flippase family protein [Xaviernesmea oryzae]OLP59017.1 hypothetical protein BJF93_03555 [Xaviernesmea oryzae]SEK90455.1 teichuronic acid exporter [Xaviernesmea oryzae]